jgi:hypothetical protein
MTSMVMGLSNIMTMRKTKPQLLNIGIIDHHHSLIVKYVVSGSHCWRICIVLYCILFYFTLLHWTSFSKESKENREQNEDDKPSSLHLPSPGAMCGRIFHQHRLSNRLDAS